MEAISRGQRNFLLFILSVAIVALSIIYVVKPNFEDRTKILDEKEQQQTYYNDLKAKDVNRQQYIDDTAAYKAGYETILAGFPSEIYQENIIMYMQGIKDEYEFRFPDVSLGEETLFYTLGTGATGDVSLGAETTETADGAEGTEGTGTASGEVYNCYSVSFPTSYIGDYDSIKDVIDYIEASEFRMTVDAVSIQFNESEGTYEGELVFSAYAVNGGDRTTDQVDVNVPVGTDNIFGNPTVRQPVNAGATTEE